MDINETEYDISLNSPLLPVIKRVQKAAESVLSAKRYEHSVRVAQTALKMCVLYKVDPARGYLAGISHDICKELSSVQLMDIACRDGNPVSAVEKERPSLLHGRAAAVLLKEDYEIYDKELLDSVAFHTFGHKKFGDLGKIVYSADKIEPGRENITAEYLEHLFSMSLNLLTKETLENCLDFVRKRNRPLAPESLDFLKKLETDIKKTKRDS